MFRQLWEWLKKLFRRIFCRNKIIPSAKIEAPLPPIDFESLFLELLRGVDDNWSRGNVKGFLTGKRMIEADLVEWLHGFGERLLASPVENEELAKQLVRLGELNIGKFSDIGYEIGKQLLARVEAHRQIKQEVREETEIASVAIINESIVNEAETWFNLGSNQVRAGDFAGAIASYEKALEFQPNHHQIWNHRGIALVKLEKYEQAIASYEKALELKSDFYSAWYNRGNALDNLEKYEQAIASYEKALELKSDFHPAWYNRGNTLDSLERYEAALASYEKALELQPDDDQAWYNRGVMLDKLEQYEEAIASYNKALELQPDKYQA